MSSFFSNLFSSLFGGNDPEAQKKRILKNIAKSLQKTKYHFYKSGSHEAEPALAKFFYEIYKALSNAQKAFQETNPKALKNVVINSMLSDNQKEIVDNLSEEAINDFSKKMDLKELSEKVKKDIEAFNSEFDNNKFTKIDTLYTKLIVMMNLCTYDYYFIIKKFDSGFREHNFSTPPKFQAINSSYIAEDLKNFIDVAWGLPFDADWDDVFKLLKFIKGSDIIAPNLWKRILSRIRTIKDRHVFEMMLQLISANPAYRDTYKTEDLHIADDYLSQIRKQADSALENIKKRQAASKVDSLLTQIFGTNAIPKLKNYNDSNCDILERKGIGSYKYAVPLSYLKQFLLEYTKKEVREISDILVIRGEWSNQQMSTPMSEAFHKLLEINDQITVLDNHMEENADWGIKIKTHLPRADRDKDSRGIIQTTLKDANNMAAQCIISAVQNFIIFDRNLKMLLEDFVKMPRSELLLNWKDLDHFAEGRLKEMCVSVYKKIFGFVQLIQNFQIKVDEE
ncbi:DUF5312 family protein [Treponema sp.]|uniref:DUF5312 family protein n=1 Tax=Treponema sp. TaxID=166 RepID=UPI0025DB3764|nr:DUF5312 family protein [Treponema sp.]MCR5218579.1 DUF5312 family protein [Treponema sp.]